MGVLSIDQSQPIPVTCCRASVTALCISVRSLAGNASNKSALHGEPQFLCGSSRCCGKPGSVMVGQGGWGRGGLHVEPLQLQHFSALWTRILKTTDSHCVLMSDNACSFNRLSMYHTRLCAECDVRSQPDIMITMCRRSNHASGNKDRSSAECCRLGRRAKAVC